MITLSCLGMALSWLGGGWGVGVEENMELLYSWDWSCNWDDSRLNWWRADEELAACWDAEAPPVGSWDPL